MCKFNIKLQVMMGTLSNEKKPRKKDICPKWPWVDYKLQDDFFLQKSRGYKMWD
jgi:hypothetical protein